MKLCYNSPKNSGGNPIKKSKEKCTVVKIEKRIYALNNNTPINPFDVLVMSYSWGCVLVLVLLRIWRLPGTKYIFAFPEMCQDASLKSCKKYKKIRNHKEKKKLKWKW